MAGPASSRGQRAARWGLAAVALAFTAGQVALVGDVPLGWDETIYASQTDPRRPALEFSAPRSRGMSFLAAPLQLLTGSVVALRVHLAVVTGLGLYVAYAAWLPLRPDASVPLAALLLTTLWTTLFYGPTLMPNVVVALVGVFATGALLRSSRGGGSRLAWASGAAVALATFVRPGDAAALVGVLLFAVVAHRPWRARWRRLLAPVVVGAALGALPWLVEAHLRYGDALSRMRRAVASQSTGERFVPDYQLRALDGPILCRPCDRATQDVPLSGALWWAVAAVLSVLAVWLVRRSGSRSATVLPLVVAGGLAAPYLLLVGYAAPRFLLPAYALLALPVAQAIRGLVVVRTMRGTAIRVAIAAAVVLAHVGAQLRILADVEQGQQGARAAWVGVSRALAARGVSPPCTLVGNAATPVAYVARCDAVRLAAHRGDEDYTLSDLTAVAREQPVALVLRPGSRPPEYAAGWVRLPRAELPRRGGFQVFVAPSTWGLTAPP